MTDRIEQGEETRGHGGVSLADAQPLESPHAASALPGADGYEVAARLRALPQMQVDVSYVALGGFGRTSDFAANAKAGFLRHLVKPADPAVPHAMLKEALAR